MSKSIRPILKTADGSYLDASGKILYFSTARFVRDICLGDCCFICGAAPGKKQFNDEHVIPQWILRKYNLYNRMITLSNGTQIPYRQNKVPCCEECNSFLGDALETPMQQLMTNGFDAFSSQIPDVVPVVFTWLCLTVFKNHYRDRLLRMERDRRAADTRIGDQYTWDELHHMHAIARSFYTGCAVEPGVVGSLQFFQVKQTDLEETFDFVDLYPAQAALVRIDDIAIVAVLNDSCGANIGFSPIGERIKGGNISNLQLREVLAHLATINLSLIERPSYRTEANGATGECTIRVTLPDAFSLNEPNTKDFGEIMERVCSDYIRAMPNCDDVLRNIQQGRYTFLFKEDGSFNDECLRLDPKHLLEPSKASGNNE